MVSASAARALAVRCTPVDVAILQGEADRATGDSFSGTGAPLSRASAVETKEQFINGVMTRKQVVKSLAFPELKVAVVGNAAVAPPS
jgi:hypothetical protein